MRLALTVVAGCLSVVGMCAAQEARAAIRKHTNIPAQELSAALQTLAKDRHLQVVFASEEVQSVRTGGAVGHLTAEEVLDRLLSGTNLTYRYLDEKTITVVPVAGPVAPKSTSLRGGDSVFAAAAGTSSDTPAPAPSTTLLEEVIVTAQKRAERLSDVPISIVALGSEELEERRVNNLDDLASAVPGLTVNRAGYSRTIFLRGISNAVGTSSLIGMYLDEVPVTSSKVFMQPDLRTYDVERVEVLRGPQGTLYGEGSAGGTIRFITRSPVLDRFSLNTDLAALVTEDGDPSQRIAAAVNVPLVQDELALRIAGTFEHEGGWIDQPAVDRKDFNSQNLMNVRVKGLWRPAPQFTVDTMAVVHRNNRSNDSGEDSEGNYSQVLNFTTTPSIEDDYDIYNVTLTYDFAAARLLSATSYVEQDLVIRDRGSRQPATLTGPPLSVYLISLPLKVDAVSEELRLTSIGSAPLQWTVGVYYRRTEDDQDQVYRVSSLPGTLFLLNHNLSRSRAAFGDASYRFDRLTLGAGLRYFEADQETSSGFALGTPATLGPALTGTFDSVDPRIYAQYELTDRINTYASAAKGFRSGGFNALNQPDYDPESVWTYELGTKMSLLQGRLTSNLALFYSDYKDYQILGRITAPSGQLLTITSNAGNARLNGVEWDFAWRPTERWTLGLSGNYIDSEFYEIDADLPTNEVGDPLDFFPKYTYTASLQRDFSTSNGRGGFARLDYSEQGRATFRNRRNGPLWFSESDIINMLNVNVTLQWNEHVSFGVFGQNLLDERGYTGAEVVTENTVRARPRTYGIQFGVDFD